VQCTGINALDPICVVAKSIGHLGASVTNSVFSSVATAFANTADSAINWLWSQMTSATSISFGGAGFELDLGIVSAIAAVVCVGLFAVQLAASALRRDATGVGRALRGLVVATLGCAITLASLDLLLAAVDQLCTGVVSMATGDSISTLGSKIIDPAMFTGLVAGPGAILILSLVAIVAVAVVWFALVVRKMLIIITAIFAPLAFVGGVADVSRGWVRKWLEAMLALVFSKLILILIFIIGLGVLGGMGSPQNAVGLSRITGDITGLLILLVAGLSPWMALKLVHFTGEHMAMVAGSATHATSGVSRVVAAPQKVASMRSTTQSFVPPPHRAVAAVIPPATTGASSRGAGNASPEPSIPPAATPSSRTENRVTGAGVAAGVVTAAGATRAAMHATQGVGVGGAAHRVAEHAAGEKVASQNVASKPERVVPTDSPVATVFRSERRTPTSSVPHTTDAKEPMGVGGESGPSAPTNAPTRPGRPSPSDAVSASPVLATPFHETYPATPNPGYPTSSTGVASSKPVLPSSDRTIRASTPQSTELSQRPTSALSAAPRRIQPPRVGEEGP
jgi:type IV secretion system protein TrbL